jgi:hypothetical protein
MALSTDYFNEKLSMEIGTRMIMIMKEEAPELLKALGWPW